MNSRYKNLGYGDHRNRWHTQVFGWCAFGARLQHRAQEAEPMFYFLFTFVVSLLVKAFTVTGGSITGAREVPELAGDRLASSTSSSRTA